MEFIDLKAPYLRYQAEIDARMQAVLQHGRFIMGPEIAGLDAQLAADTRGLISSGGLGKIRCLDLDEEAPLPAELARGRKSCDDLRRPNAE